MVRPRPLLLVPHAPIGVSLPGLVAASARLNVLGDVKPVLRSAGLPLRPGYIAGLVVGREAALAARLGCPEATIVAASTPPLDVPDGAMVRWGDGAIRREWLDSRLRRVAPGALRSSNHHRATWCNRLLGHCPETLETLVDRCARCGRDQRWLAAEGLGWCDRRGCGPLDAIGEPLPGELADDYRMFASLCSPIPQEREIVHASLAPVLAELPPAILIDFIFRLGLALQDSTSSPRKALTGAAPAERSRVAARGAAALRQWPLGLRAEIRHELAVRGSADGAARRRLRAGMLAAASVLPSDDAGRPSILLSALPEIRGEIGRSFIGIDGARLLGSDAARRLGISHGALRRHADAGMFVAEGVVERGYRRALYESSVIDEAASAWRRSDPIARLIRALGLPRYACEMIVGAGDVVRETHPFALTLADQPRTLTASTDAYLSSLVEACRHEAPPPGVVRLDAALKIVGGRLKPWRQVLDAVRSKKLKAWMEASPAPIVRRIRVLPADIAHHLMRSADEGLLDGAFVSPAMSQVDAMTVLNLRQIDGPLLASAKLLRFDKGRRSLLVEVDEVLAIARGHVATPEAAARIGIGPAAAWHETSHVLGPPQSPAGWPRRRFDDWLASRNPLS